LLRNAQKPHYSFQKLLKKKVPTSFSGYLADIRRFFLWRFCAFLGKGSSKAPYFFWGKVHVKNFFKKVEWGFLFPFDLFYRVFWLFLCMRSSEVPQKCLSKSQKYPPKN
jgi:hypothetical protein